MSALAMLAKYFEVSGQSAVSAHQGEGALDDPAVGLDDEAARLCGEAKDGQILVSRRVAIAVEDSATLKEIGDLPLKGLSQAVAVYNVVAAGALASAS